MRGSDNNGIRMACGNELRCFMIGSQCLLDLLFLSSSNLFYSYRRMRFHCSANDHLRVSAILYRFSEVGLNLLFVTDLLRIGSPEAGERFLDRIDLRSIFFAEKI